MPPRLPVVRAPSPVACGAARWAIAFAVDGRPRCSAGGTAASDQAGR